MECMQWSAYLEAEQQLSLGVGLPRSPQHHTGRELTKLTWSWQQRETGERERGERGRGEREGRERGERDREEREISVTIIVTG